MSPGGLFFAELALFNTLTKTNQEPKIILLHVSIFLSTMSSFFFFFLFLAFVNDTSMYLLWAVG